MRKLALALACSAALGMPQTSQALGLGQIETRSYLNQPLDASVMLQSSAADNLDSLSIRLANEQAFKRAGIPRPYELTQLKFKLERDRQGQPYIRISTPRPINEPFLSFLLEIEWDRGRLLREYTILLDPPMLMTSQPLVSRPVVSQPEVGDRRSVEVREREAAAAGTYRVHRNDTLWKIARDNRPDASLSINSMMMALFEDNPQAFINNNINRLKAGSELHLPAAERVMRIDPASAQREVARQERPSKPVATTPSSSSVSAKEPAGASRLNLLPPEEETVVVEEPVTATGAEPATEEALDIRSAAQIEVLTEELGIAQEISEARQIEVDQLNRRLESLEEQTAKMERLLTLKNEELTELKNALAQANQRQAQVPEATVTVAPEQAWWSNPFLTAVLGGGVVGLLALLLGMRRRREEDEAAEAASAAYVAPAQTAVPHAAEAGTPAEAMPEQDKADPEEVMAGEKPSVGLESSAGEAFVVEEAHADLVEEAEVMLAYGLHDKAADILREGLQSQPDNRAYRAKLLEALYTGRETEAFLTEAKTYANHKPEDDAGWEQIRLWGSELLPEETLFSKAEQSVSTREEEAVDAEPFGLSAEPVSKEEEVLREELAPLELDLDVQPKTETAPDAETEAAASTEDAVTDEHTLAFDVSDLEIGQAESEQQQAPAGADEELLQPLDFQIPAGADSQAADEQDMPEAVVEIAETESAVASNTESDEFLEPLAPLSLAGADAEAEDFLEPEPAPDAEEEIATKLDLARAFMDMGDIEGARMTLEEVIAQGNAEQREDATQLLQKVS